MKLSDMTLDPAVQSLFLSGGQMLMGLSNSNNSHRTVLIRMPKDARVQDTRPGQEDNTFEFVICQNLLEPGCLIIAEYRNGNLRSIKNETEEEHRHGAW